MKERSILFSGEMVRVILDGRKTQTRRVLKKQPIDILPMKVQNLWVTLEEINPNHGRVIKCRFGVPGDRLWVRETWAHDDMNCNDIHCGNIDHIWYRASESPVVADSFAGAAHWRPSIFMPRWASRITLEIVSVRVERVQDISANDAIAEGVCTTQYWKPKEVENKPFEEKWWDDYYFWNHYPQIAYQNLWNSINFKRGFGWDVNPWVWVMEFKGSHE